MSAETLLDIFSPPEGMVGHSAVLVALTATEDFLEDAMQRFTELRPRQRAELGYVHAYLMLDGHASPSRQRVFSPGRIPGLHEFQPRAIEPGSLLHAKMALLAFAPTRTGEAIHLRLALLTANFTYTSARQQLELVWTVDVPLDSAVPAQDRADITNAGSFVETLLSRRFYRDEQSLTRSQRRLTARLDALLTAAANLPSTNRKPRFIHSLDRPLYEQIRERFRSAIGSPTNLLLCGSGFYEEPSNKPRKPQVFAKLEALNVFTSNVRRIALVEPSQAGAVANWARSGEVEGWELSYPVDVLGHRRRLHAKFIYTGHVRNWRVGGGCIYLGSGNLSRRGLLTNGTMPEGNVETGVVFPVNERLDQGAISRLLFWRDEAIADEQWVVGQVGDAPDEQQLLEAPPILSAMIWQEPERRLFLLWREDAPSDQRVSIRWTGRDWIRANGRKWVALQESDAPTALHVRLDDRSNEWIVPIIDPEGRVSWQPPRFGTFAEALAALLDFPIRPAEATDNEDDYGDAGSTATTDNGNCKAVEQEKSYALHSAAELVEKVAELQAGLPAALLDDWLDHLDRMFRASFPEQLVALWREYRLDVFAHLREPELRPPQLTDEQRARYGEILDNAAIAWRLR